jgi:hypothetical protein
MQALSFLSTYPALKLNLTTSSRNGLCTRVVQWNEYLLPSKLAEVGLVRFGLDTF